MKLPYLLPLLAAADAYRPQYDFAPPPVITPQPPLRPAAGKPV